MLEKLKSILLIFKEAIQDFFDENKYYFILGIIEIILLSLIGFYFIGVLVNFDFSFEMLFLHREKIWLNNKELIVHPFESIGKGVFYNQVLLAVIVMLNVVTSIKSMIKIKTQLPYVLNMIGLGGVIVDKKGTFGSASWLTSKGIAKLIEKGILSHSNGVVIGALKKNAKKIEDILFKHAGDKRRNRHTIVFGGSGSGKSFCFAIPNLILAAREKRSAICTDPKGELYGTLSLFFRWLNIRVMKLNLLCPKKSDKFNPFVYITSVLDAFLFVQIILENTSIDMDIDVPKGDPFWEKGETNLLKALTLYIWEYESERNKNMPTLYDYITMPIYQYQLLFDDIPNDKACKKCYNIFMDGEERVQQGIKVGLASRLQIFQLDDIREMMSENEIDIYALKKEHSMLFVLSPDTHSMFDYIQALLFNFVFVKLAGLEDAKDETCNYFELDVIGDEIANIGRIPKFDTLIATLRSRRINFLPIFQDSDQVKKLYPKSYNTIIGNCDVKIFLGGSNPDTNEEISTRLGTQSIKTISKTKDNLDVSVSRFSVSEQQRRLIDACELEQLDDDEVIVMIRGQKPMKLFKYGWIHMPEAEEIQKRIAHPAEYMPDEFIPEESYSM